MATDVADLTGVRAKLRRAKEHHSTLKVEFDVWGKEHADALIFHVRRDGPWYVITANPVPQPDIRFSTIAGDIIHNLRSALDHLVWQLVLRDGHEPSRRNEFPICERKERFFNEVKFRKSKPKLSVLYGITVDGDAWTIIERAQPYHCVPVSLNRVLILGRLSNMDKHRTLCIQMPFVRDINEVIGWSPEAILLEQRVGKIDLSLEEITEVVRYRFADKPYPNVHMKGRLAFYPTFGEGAIEYGCQVTLGYFSILINAVTKIVDDISKLPRVIDV